MAQIVPERDSLEVNEGWKIVPDSKSDSTQMVDKLQKKLNFRDSMPIAPRPISSLPTNVKYSEDALDEPLDYSARDSQHFEAKNQVVHLYGACLLYTSPSPRDLSTSRMPSSA